MSGSGDEFESVAVDGAHNGEVAAVECGDGGDVEAFGDGDDRGVDEPEAEIFVAADQLDGPNVVGGGDVDDVEFTGDYRVDQRCFGVDADVVLELPRGFRDPRSTPVSTRIGTGSEVVGGETGGLFRSDLAVTS